MLNGAERLSAGRRQDSGIGAGPLSEEFMCRLPMAGRCPLKP